MWSRIQIKQVFSLQFHVLSHCAEGDVGVETASHLSWSAKSPVIESSDHAARQSTADKRGDQSQYGFADRYAWSEDWRDVKAVQHTVVQDQGLRMRHDGHRQHAAEIKHHSCRTETQAQSNRAQSERRKYSRRIVIHSSCLPPVCPTSHRRARIRTSADSVHCKNKMSRHRAQRGSLWLCLRSFRRLDLWSSFSFHSWSGSLDRIHRSFRSWKN